MRLTILTQYFPPEIGAPQTRLSELGERLIDLDWEVKVLTALPNYPTGRVFPGYDLRAPTCENIGRIRTTRVPIHPAQAGFMKRLWCFFSFALSAMRYGPTLCQSPDLLFVESPPLFICFAARYLAKRWRCPYVLNVSDLWPESAVRMGVIKPGLLSGLAERLELNTYTRAAGVTGQSTEIIASVRRRCPSVPTEIILNGVDCARFGPGKVDAEARALLGADPGPVFLYAGLLGLAQGLDQLLDIAKALPENVPGRIVLIGDGPERRRLEQRIKTEQIERVKCVGPQPRERIPALLAAANVALISLGMSIPGAVPSKIYEAMASGLPILLIASGEGARRVEESGCGLTVPPGELEKARAAFCQLVQDPDLRHRLGERGRTAAETVYNRDIIAQRLDRFLRSLFTPHHATCTPASLLTRQGSHCR